MEVTTEEVLAARLKEYDLNRTTVRPPSFLAEYASGPRNGEFISEIYHEATKTTKMNEMRVSRSMQDFSSGKMATAKTLLEVDYPKAETVDLPEPSLADASLADAFHARRSVREYDPDEPLTRQEVATLLGLGAGETGGLRDQAGREKGLRSYPSPGGLYPVEVYPVVFDVDGLDAGVYYYNPGRHVLRLLDRTDDGFVEEFADRANVPDDLVAWDTVSAVFLLMGSFWRVRAKYGPRGYRFALQETGHLAQNVLLAAAALGLGSVPLGGFDDDAVSDLLGANGVEEAVLYLLPVGNVEGRR